MVRTLELAQNTAVGAVVSSSEVTIASLFQGCPVGDPEQIDTYLEALLKEDVFLSHSTSNEVAVDKGRSSSLE